MNLKHQFKGCLYSDPVCPTNINTLRDGYISHQCPCCGTKPFAREAYLNRSLKDIVEKVINIEGRLFSVETSECQCGFFLPLVVLMNDVVLNEKKKIPMLDTAVVLGAHHFLENKVSSAEFIVFYSRVLIHKHAYSEALELLEQEQNRLANNAEAAFNRALCLERMGYRIEALEVYDNCLDLNSECVEAWHNRVQLLSLMGRDEEAEFNLAKLQRFMPIAIADKKLLLPKKEFSVVKNGIFGAIEVRQTRTQRFLVIDQQIQGASWLYEGEVDAIPASSYMGGVLCAMSDISTGRSLMLGLGSGAGAIVLLAQFPDLLLDVVEIDPVLIELSTQYFPLLKYFIEKKRLNIINADAFEFIHHCRNCYKAVVIDVFSGEAEANKIIFEKPVVNRIKQLGDRVIVNLIDVVKNSSIEKCLSRFRQAGLAFKHLIPIDINRLASDEQKNYILSSQEITALAEFSPFRQREDFIARAFRRDIEHLKRLVQSV